MNAFVKNDLLKPCQPLSFIFDRASLYANNLSYDSSSITSFLSNITLSCLIFTLTSRATPDDSVFLLLTDLSKDKFAPIPNLAILNNADVTVSPKFIAYILDLNCFAASLNLRTLRCFPSLKLNNVRVLTVLRSSRSN